MSPEVEAHLAVRRTLTVGKELEQASGALMHVHRAIQKLQHANQQHRNVNTHLLCAVLREVMSRVERSIVRNSEVRSLPLRLKRAIRASQNRKYIQSVNDDLSRLGALIAPLISDEREERWNDLLPFMKAVEASPVGRQIWWNLLVQFPSPYGRDQISRLLRSIEQTDDEARQLLRDIVRHQRFRDRWVYKGRLTQLFDRLGAHDFASEVAEECELLDSNSRLMTLQWMVPLVWMERHPEVSWPQELVDCRMELFRLWSKNRESNNVGSGLMDALFSSHEWLDEGQGCEESPKKVICPCQLEFQGMVFDGSAQQHPDGRKFIRIYFRADNVFSVDDMQILSGREFADLLRNRHLNIRVHVRDNSFEAAAVVDRAIPLIGTVTLAEDEKPSSDPCI